MDKIFKALSDRHRRKILELLKEKDMCVSDLLKHFSFRQASLSHHLQILKISELIKSQRRWQYIYYSINRDVFNKTSDFIKVFTTKKEEHIIPEIT